MEALKESFYKEVVFVMNQELKISNTGVQKFFEKWVLHLEKAMTYPRIINQFDLCLKRWKNETGIETKHHFEAIKKFIELQPKNY